jgi:hypothetical protein
MWSESLASNEEERLRQFVSQTAGCVAARIFTLADAQRQNQLKPPWHSLVIYEMQNADVLPSLKGASAGWSYVAVSGHVSRAAT